MSGNDNDSEVIGGSGIAKDAQSGSRIPGGLGAPAPAPTPTPAAATSSPSAASLMEMFAPPPPPPPPPPIAGSSDLDVSEGGERSARSGSSRCSAPPPPFLSSSPAAAQLMGIFAPPPGSGLSASAPFPRKTAGVSGLEGDSPEVPRPSRPPLPGLPASGLRERQTTETRSNRSATGSSIPVQSSITDSSTDADEGPSSGDMDANVSASFGTTPPTRNISTYLRNFQSGLSQRAPMNEHDERSALLLAHAFTSPDRVLAPNAGLSTLHDMFRPPSETGGDMVVETSAEGAAVMRGSKEEGLYASMASAATPEVRNGVKGMRDIANVAMSPKKEYLIPVKGQHASPKIPPRAKKPTLQSHCASALSYLGRNLTREAISSTVIGSSVFVLYHVVFCLAYASSIVRPSHSSDEPSQMLAPMVQMAALGSIAANPTYIFLLGSDLPAVYPCVDLFLAPFSAHLAAAVDETLVADEVKDDGAGVFLATFAALNCVALLLSAALCYLGSQLKLANLGAFLPYSVICGFFSAVAIMLWMLAFSVDTGLGAGDVLLSGDWAVVKNCVIHHVPSVCVAVLMKVLGPKKPWLTPVLVLCTAALGYLVMLLTGTPLSQAQELGWFWTKDEFVFERDGNSAVAAGLWSWSPPAPFGVLPSMFQGKVHLPAFVAGLPGAVAMAAVYLLRCSIHAAALKKNAANLLRIKAEMMMRPPSLPACNGSSPPHVRHRFRSGADKEELESVLSRADDDEEEEEEGMGAGEAITVSMLKILSCYGAGLALAAVIGGYGALPSIAAGSSMVKIGASSVAPQYGSNLLLLIFYLFNFAPVSYVPKPAFSCLIILAFIDLSDVWLVRSFSKMKNKVEWLVVPVIVVFTFLIGMLQSVGLGIALSTFIFVGNLYRTGTVKFISSGLTIRSTIERNSRDADWLDQNGDLIQMLVLQNYLFFGNASSINEYVMSMFEQDPAPSEIDFALPPMPKYLVIDLTLVTGLDTAGVDVMADIISLCNSHQCQVSIAGCSPIMRSILSCGGLKPSRGRRSLKFYPDLESALGKAEDHILKHILRAEVAEIENMGTRTRERARSTSGDDGFLRALRLIDEQHGIQFAPKLEKIHRYTQPVDLRAGETLFGGNGVSENRERGLFFIESGLMKVERDPSYTMTRGSNASLRRKVGPGFFNQRLFNEGSIGHLRARTPTIGREGALLKATAGHRTRTSHNLRLARIGPGWVVGAIEGLTGLRNPGTHVAITSCRLHLLTYRSLEDIERKNPALALTLFKLMSHLMSRRQELTIEHLSTLHSIMTSPAPTKPMSRITMGAIQKAIDYQ